MVIQRTRQNVSSLVSRFNKIRKEMLALQNGGEAPRGARIPQMLDIRKLFCLDVDDQIWNDDGLGGIEEETAPRWLADDKVRDGIAALLEQDRCEEEEERLVTEQGAMHTWLWEEWAALKESLLLNKGESSDQWGLGSYQLETVTFTGCFKSPTAAQIL
jgi:hypothetical protein